MIGMKKFIIATVLVLLTLPIWAVDAYIIPLSSPFYDIIDDLYALEGLGSPSDVRPYSAAEAEMFLTQVDEDSLTGYSKTLYDKAASIVEETVRWQFGDGFGLGARLGINPEVYMHINGEDFYNEEQWAYSYDDRKHFLELGLEFSVGDFFYTYADLMYTMGRYSEGATFLSSEDFSSGIGALLPLYEYEEQVITIDGESVTVLVPVPVEYYIVDSSPQYQNGLSSNIPLKSALFEFEWPKRAFVAFGGDMWTLQFGRERLDWGNSRVSNFIIDSHVGYHDVLRLSVFTDHFSYEWDNIFFQTAGRVDSSYDSGIRILMAHRLEFRPIRYISFAVSENVMYESPSLNLGYMNPGNIYHNLNNRQQFNAIASAELNIMPLRGLDIYAQAVLDQARAPNESASQGSAWGILAGVEYSFSPAECGVFSLNVEFDYTSPLLYRRDGVDFLMFQRSVTMDIDASTPMKLYYIGYRYGGDVALLHFGADWRLYDVTRVYLSADFALKGEMDMAYSHNVDDDNGEYPNYPGTTPSGNLITRFMVVTLGGEYEIPGLPDWMSLSLSSSLSLVGSQVHDSVSGTTSDGSFDVQASFALSLSL